MATQLEELRATPVEMLREMRRSPGVYSRALIERVAQEKAQEGAAVNDADATRRQYSLIAEQREKRRAEDEASGPSGFRQDYRRGLQSVAPVYRDIEGWLGKKFGAGARDAMSRRDALNKMRLSLPNDGIFEYFNRQTPERAAAPAIRSFIDQNSATLINDPAEYEAFVSDPSGYIQMRSRVLTPREKGDRLAPTVEANGAPPAGPAQMAGAEPDAGPEAIPAPYLPPLMATASAQTQGDAPPWLRPKAPDGGAVGEGGSTAGGRPVIPTAPVPAQNPAMAAITAGQQAASETVAPAVAAAAAGPEAAGVAEAEGAMSPELRQATQDYLKLVNADGDTDERDRYLSLAKAGFAMASSGSPYLLQAVGQGGNAGLDAYQAARARAAERRLRGAQGTLEVAKIGEDVRRAGSRERLDRDRLAAETARDAAAGADRAAARDLQREELDVRREGQKLQERYYNRPDYNILGQDENGNAIIYDQRSGGTKVLPGVKATGRGAGGDVEKALEVRQRIVNEMYPTLSREERADIVFGRSNPSASELRVKAREMARRELINAADYRVTGGGKDKLPYDVAVQRKTDEIMDFLRGQGVSAPAPAAAPAGRAPAADPRPGATIRYDAQGNRIP